MAQSSLTWEERKFFQNLRLNKPMTIILLEISNLLGDKAVEIRDQEKSQNSDSIPSDTVLQWDALRIEAKNLMQKVSRLELAEEAAKGNPGSSSLKRLSQKSLV